MNILTILPGQKDYATPAVLDMFNQYSRFHPNLPIFAMSWNMVSKNRIYILTHELKDP